MAWGCRRRRVLRLGSLQRLPPPAGSIVPEECQRTLRAQAWERLSSAQQLVEGSGLLTWSENRCEVCGLEEPKPSLLRHVFRGHGLVGTAALHNYLASI